MPDKELSRYLPRCGNRLAVFAFARQLFSATDERGVCQSDVLDKLQMTLQQKRNVKGNRPSAVGNKHAKEETRRVELGWKACVHLAATAK